MKLKFKMIPAITLGAVVALITSCAPSTPTLNIETNGKDLKTNVTFFSNIWGDDEKNMMNEIIADFNAIYPDIKIDLQLSGRYWEIDEKIQGLLKTPNKLPSLAVCYPDYVVNYLSAGVVLDMNPYMDNELIGLGKKPGKDVKDTLEDKTTLKDDLNGAFLKEGQSYLEKGTYSLPWYKNSEALFYNIDVLNKYIGEGQYNLTNWEDIISVGRALLAKKDIVTKKSVKQDGKYVGVDHTVEWKKGLSTPIGYDSTGNLYITFSEMLGAPYGGNKDENGDGKINKSEAVKFYDEKTNKPATKAKQMVKMLKGWYDEGLITTSDMVAKTGSDSKAGVWNYYNYNQECFIYVNGSKNAWYGSSNLFRGEVLPTPTIDDGMLKETPVVTNKKANSKAMSQGANIVFFDKNDEENAGAWLFYKFLTDTSHSAKVAKQMSSMPIRETSYQDDQIKAITNSSAALPETPNQGKNYDYLQKKVYNIYENYDKNEQTFIAPVSQFSSKARNAVSDLLINVFDSAKTGEELDTFIDAEFKKAYEAC